MSLFDQDINIEDANRIGAATWMNDENNIQFLAYSWDGSVNLDLYHSHKENKDMYTFHDDIILLKAGGIMIKKNIPRYVKFGYTWADDPFGIIDDRIPVMYICEEFDSFRWSPRRVGELVIHTQSELTDTFHAPMCEKVSIYNYNKDVLDLSWCYAPYVSINTSNMTKLILNTLAPISKLTLFNCPNISIVKNMQSYTNVRSVDSNRFNAIYNHPSHDDEVDYIFKSIGLSNISESRIQKY